MRTLVFALVFLYFLPPLSAEESGLAAAVHAVLAHNPDLKAAEAQMREAQAGRQEAQSMKLPMLTARSRLSRGDQPVYVFGSLLEQGRFGAQDFAIDALNHPGDLTNIQSGLDLGIPLFTGYEITSAVRLGELTESKARSGFEGTAQELRLQSATLYFQLLLDRDLLKTLDERIAASDSELADAQKLKERGLVFGSDFYAAEAISSGLQAWRIQIQTDQQASLERLSILSGKEGWEPKESLTDQTIPVAASSDLEKIALLKRPDLNAAGSQVAMADVSRRQSDRSLLPKVQAFASLETNTNDFGYNPSNHTFGVEAKLPFGDPAYFARRARAQAAKETAEASRNNLEESIRMEVADAYHAYQGALAGLPIVKEAMDRAAQSLHLFRPLYRSGRQSILEVLRAEEGLAKAQSAYLCALLHAHTSYLQLQAATGSLDDQTIQAMSKSLAGTAP